MRLLFRQSILFNYLNKQTFSVPVLYLERASINFIQAKTGNNVSNNKEGKNFFQGVGTSFTFELQCIHKTVLRTMHIVFICSHCKSLLWYTQDSVKNLLLRYSSLKTLPEIYMYKITFQNINNVRFNKFL